MSTYSLKQGVINVGTGGLEVRDNQGEVIVEIRKGIIHTRDNFMSWTRSIEEVLIIALDDRLDNDGNTFQDTVQSMREFRR